MIKLPVLAQSRWLRFGVFTSYYLLQGLPWGVCVVALPAWFIMKGMAIESVASFSAVTALPWTLKLVVGPLMDRYSFLPMGMRRPWIIGAQAMMLLTCCSLFFITDPIGQFWWLMVICTIMNVFAATEDVAVDGLAITIIPENERGRANAFMGSGQLLGISITGAAAVALLNSWGITAVAIFLVAIVTILLVISISIRERTGERFLPWTKGEANPDMVAPTGSLFVLFKDLFKALLLPMSIVIIIVTFTHRLHAGIIKIWFPDIAINGFGYTDGNYANWKGITTVVGALIGLLFGPVIDRIGARKVFSVTLLVTTLWYLLLFLLVNMLEHPFMAALFFLIDSLTLTLLFISYIAVGMTLCRVKIAATQFACYMALANFGMAVGSGIYPSVINLTGLTNVSLVLAAIFAFCWAVMWIFDLDRHKGDLARLENS